MGVVQVSSLCDPLHSYSKSCRNKPNFSGLNSLEFGIFAFLIIDISQKHDVYVLN